LRDIEDVDTAFGLFQKLESNYNGDYRGELADKPTLVARKLREAAGEKA
jgi:hypothetical protein